MTHRALAIACLFSLCACKNDGIVAQGNDSTLDRSSTSWNDGPKPTPDPALPPAASDAGADARAPDEPTLDAGPDGGLQDGGPSDAGPDASPDAA